MGKGTNINQFLFETMLIMLIVAINLCTPETAYITECSSNNSNFIHQRTYTEPASAETSDVFLKASCYKSKKANAVM
jgi:hypothetical protein